MNSNRQFFAKGRVFFRRIGAALALPRLAACKAPAAFALSLIIALSFAGPPGGALAAAKAPSKEDYEALKEEWRKAQAKEKALAESCPDSQSKTQPVCALNLVEIRVLQEDREKKLTRMEKSLGIKTSFKEKAEEEKTEEKTQAPKNNGIRCQQDKETTKIPKNHSPCQCRRRRLSSLKPLLPSRAKSRLRLRPSGLRPILDQL